MTRIDAVLLDVGGVFYLPAPERIGPVLARAGVTLPHDEAFDEAHFRGIAAIDEFREGDEEVWATYNRAYARSCGVGEDALAETVGSLMSEFTVSGLWTRPIVGAREALAELAALGVRIAIVSNSDGTVEERLLEDEVCQVGTGPGVEVDAILDSALVGAAKPDPKIFEVALAELGVTAEAAIHVGDTPGADVDGAHAAGVRPVLIDPLELHTALDVTRVHGLGQVIPIVAASRRGQRAQI